MKLASQNGMASADIGADGAKPAEGPKKMQRGDQSKCYGDRPRLVPITEMLAIILEVERLHEQAIVTSRSLHRLQGPEQTRSLETTQH